jgi:hypothetical protein
MINKPNISCVLNSQYFWDVDVTELDVDKAKRLIIERVFVLGKAVEINLVISYYGSGEVAEVLKNLNYIDPKTLNFVSKLFKIPLQSFKCYRRRQLTPPLWNF